MAITDRYVAGGTQISFSVEGATSTSPSGTVSKDLKPDADDAAWADIAHVSAFTPEKNVGNRIQVMKPLPGRKRLVDVIETDVIMQYTFNIEIISPLFFQLLYGTEDLTASSTQFNPLEKFDLKGWIKAQTYNQDDVLINTVDQWSHISANGPVNFDEDNDIVRCPVIVLGLHSSKNTGTPS